MGLFETIANEREEKDSLLRRLATAIVNTHVRQNSNGADYCRHCFAREEPGPSWHIEHKPDCDVLVAEAVLAG